MYIYIYIYVLRERERDIKREREREFYIYIYIEREREISVELIGVHRVVYQSFQQPTCQSSIETKEATSCAAAKPLMCCGCLKRRLLKR